MAQQRDRKSVSRLPLDGGTANTAKVQGSVSSLRVICASPRCGGLRGQVGYADLGQLI